MSTKISAPVPININPGVQPSTDQTAAKTNCYTDTLAVRFVNGIPQKRGGSSSIDFDYGDTVDGTIRNVFTSIINDKIYCVIGTNVRLYAVIGSRLENITPFQASSTAAANSLSTQYNTLGSNPFAAVSGSAVLTVTDSDGASRLQPGDNVTFSGATGFAGILAGSINGVKLVRSTNPLAGTYTINVGTNANATTSGGGASVVRSSGLIRVTVANTLMEDDRVKISGAANTGGISNTLINAEFIIRNVTAAHFDFMTTGTATSSVTAAGGGSTVFYPPIAAGNLNEIVGQGYGAGLYGAGLYGTALVSSSARELPQIWFCDRYANTFIVTPGNQGGIYQWMGSAATAPTPITGSNAPTAVNYAFVASNILVTLGAGGIENRIFASDQNDITTWISSSTNQVFDDDTEGAGRYLSHCPVDNLNLLFTENQTYTFRYIGLPLVWEVLQLDESIGIIAPMARVPVKGMGFWMGTENFYMYRGGKVEVIPANTQRQCTALNYVFGNINWGQKSKCFAWYNPQYNEVWFHYPSATSNECDSLVRVNLLDFTWSIDQMDRTAGENPAVTQNNPILANVGVLYKEEVGTDDDGEPLPFSLTGPKQYLVQNNSFLSGIIPDSLQTGNINLTTAGYRFPQSAVASQNQVYTVGPTTEQINITGAARYWQLNWSGNELGQGWQMGEWATFYQDGARQ
jgi:hypothetical protein